MNFFIWWWNWETNPTTFCAHNSSNKETFLIFPQTIDGRTGSGLVRYKAEVDFDGRELTRSYIVKQDLQTILEEVQNMKTIENLETFFLKHGENIVDLLGAEIDRIEKELKVSSEILLFKIILFHLSSISRKNILKSDIVISNYCDSMHLNLPNLSFVKRHKAKWNCPSRSVFTEYFH